MLLYDVKIIFTTTFLIQVETNIHATPSPNLTSFAFHMTAIKTAQTPSTTMWASAPQIHVLDSWTMLSGAMTMWLTAAVWQRWKRGN